MRNVDVGQSLDERVFVLHEADMRSILVLSCSLFT